MLRLGEIQGVLRNGNRVAGSTGAEDRAGVVGGLAPTVTRSHGQLLEQVVGAELQLQTVVVGEAGVGAGAQNACAAIHASHITASARSNLLGSGARSESGGELREFRS